MKPAPAPRVSLAAARELLWANNLVNDAHESYRKRLTGACRAIHIYADVAVYNHYRSAYVCICGRKPGHRGAHEDVAGGIYW